MIVKCEQCQTKFKIPDEKVTEKGVKVRCTKCQHTFRVKKEGAPAEVTAPPSPPPPEPPRKSALLPGAADVPPEVFDRPTKVGPRPVGLDAPAQGSEGKTGQFTFDPSDPFKGLETEVTQKKTSPDATVRARAPLPPPAPAADPFADPAAAPAESAPALGRSSVPPDSLFGNQELSAASNAFASSEPDRGLFDLPEKPAPPPPDPFAEVAAPAPTEQVQSPLMTPPVLPVDKPTGRPDDVGIREENKPGVARRLTGVFVNVGIAAALILGIAAVGTAYLNEGKLDRSALSFERLKALWAPRELVAVDISNGLYDTRGGRSVFFVRGEVSNRGSHPTRVRVRAQVYDGSQVLLNAEALAGASPTPEDLYALSSAQDAEKLVQKLNHAAVEIAPGQRAPFLLTFYDYPPDLAGLRLKVTVEEATGKTTASRE